MNLLNWQQYTPYGSLRTLATTPGYSAELYAYAIRWESACTASVFVINEGGSANRYYGNERNALLTSD